MKLLMSLLMMAPLIGCSSIQSVQSADSDSAGLYYYMPNKNFVVTISTKYGQVTNATFVESTAYPDLSARYLLTYSRNLVGKNTMTVGINERGLLTSATSETVAGISDALKNLASATGTFGALGTRAGPKAPTNCADGDHVFVLEAQTIIVPNLCGVQISIQRIPPGDKAPAAVKPQPETLAGIYYRQNEPYLIKATGGAIDKGAVLFSPSNSSTRLLPISGTLFANNKADLGFTDGVPTKYNLDTDGELIALFKLPADVVAAYFTAVGTVFDSFKTNDGKQVAELDAATKLALAKQKYDACLAAIKAKDDAAIAKLGC